MQIIRTLCVVSFLALTLGGCTIIRGTAAGPSGEASYARQGHYTGKVKGTGAARRTAGTASRPARLTAPNTTV